MASGDLNLGLIYSKTRASSSVLFLDPNAIVPPMALWYDLDKYPPKVHMSRFVP